MNYEKIRENPGQFKSLTSYEVCEFDALLEIFASKLHVHFEYKTLKGAYRQRKYSPRKTEYLPTDADKLFFILIYLKNNPLQEYHAAAFGLTQDMANKWIHLLINILDVTIQPPHELTFIHRFGPHPSSPPKVRVPFAKIDLEYQYTY